MDKDFINLIRKVAANTLELDSIGLQPNSVMNEANIEEHRSKCLELAAKLRSGVMEDYIVGCRCRRCEEKHPKELPEGIGPLALVKGVWWMVVCTECGNKRCPHATHHIYPCTHSNEPGQKGSDYE